MAKKSEAKAAVEKNAEIQGSIIAKAESVPKQIQVVGPADETNGAAVLRFQREGNKKAIDITKGQILSVGDEGDVSEDEARRLLNYSRWEVKEYKEGDQ